MLLIIRAIYLYYAICKQSLLLPFWETDNWESFWKCLLPKSICFWIQHKVQCVLLNVSCFTWDKVSDCQKSPHQSSWEASKQVNTYLLSGESQKGSTKQVFIDPYIWGQTINFLLVNWTCVVHCANAVSPGTAGFN